MTALTRTLASLTLILIVLVSAVAIRPGWASNLGVDFLAELHQQSEMEDERQAELERLDAMVKQRLKGRRAAIHDLIEGRKNLFETAAMFRELNALAGECRCRYREAYPGATDEERLSRHVIAWVRGELEIPLPRFAEELCQRLNKELEEHLRCDGTVHLPSPGGEEL